MDRLSFDTVTLVRLLHAQYTAWGHSGALVDAVTCVESLAAATGQPLDVVDGLPWHQWRSMHIALWAAWVELGGFVDRDGRAAAASEIAARARSAGGSVLPAVAAWLDEQVVGGGFDRDRADEAFDRIDDAICAAFEMLAGHDHDC